MSYSEALTANKNALLDFTAESEHSSADTGSLGTVRAGAKAMGETEDLVCEDTDLHLVKEGGVLGYEQQPIRHPTGQEGT